jgi:hypothetical protein
MAQSTNVVQLPRPVAEEDTLRYGRSAWTAIGVAWAIAILRLGIAISRREQDVDSLLALSFVACLPAYAVVRTWSRRSAPPPANAEAVATIIPFRPRAGRTPPTDPGAAHRRAS